MIANNTKLLVAVANGNEKRLYHGCMRCYALPDNPTLSLLI